MNIFERKINNNKILGFIGLLLFAAGIVCAIAIGTIYGEESSLILIPMLGGFLPGLFAAIFGFTFCFLLKYNYRIAKVLFTENELMNLDSAFFLNVIITEKAKRLLHECKEKNDMREYEEFRELVNMSRPAGGFGKSYL